MSVYKNIRDVLKKFELSYSGDWFRIAPESARKEEIFSLFLC